MIFFRRSNSALIPPSLLPRPRPIFHQTVMWVFASTQTLTCAHVGCGGGWMNWRGWNKVIYLNTSFYANWKLNLKFSTIRFALFVIFTMNLLVNWKKCVAALTSFYDVAIFKVHGTGPNIYNKEVWKILIHSTFICLLTPKMPFFPSHDYSDFVSIFSNCYINHNASIYCNFIF